MSFTRLLTQPLTITHRGPTDPPTTDDYGNEVIVDTGTSTLAGYIEQTDATEVTVDRETYVSNWLLVLDAGAELHGRDRVSYGDVTLEVIGKPHQVWNPRTGSVHHVEARLREVTG